MSSYEKMLFIVVSVVVLMIYMVVSIMELEDEVYQLKQTIEIQDEIIENYADIERLSNELIDGNTYIIEYYRRNTAKTKARVDTFYEWLVEVMK